MKVTRTSELSRVTRTMDLNITPAQVVAYERGALIQDAFPNLTADEREFYKTGITAEEWSNAFGDVDAFGDVEDVDDDYGEDWGPEEPNWDACSGYSD